MPTNHLTGPNKTRPKIQPETGHDCWLLSLKNKVSNGYRATWLVGHTVHRLRAGLEQA